MTRTLRIATFNLENLDDRAGAVPSLAERIAVLRPMLTRLAADVLCLQEVNAQPDGKDRRRFRALDSLLEGTPYAAYDRVGAHRRRRRLQCRDARDGAAAWYRQVEIHNEALGDELVAHASIEASPESYHAPVVAEFTLPEG